MNIRNFFMEQVPAKNKKDPVGTLQKGIPPNEEDPNSKVIDPNTQNPDAQPPDPNAQNPDAQPPDPNAQNPDGTGGMDPLTQSGYDSGGPELLISDDPVENINKMYRLKKIFVKTQTVADLLNKFTDPKYDDIRKQVSDANDMLTNILIPNLPSYKDSIDKIMKNYETFLLSCSKNIDELYSKKKT